MAKTENTSHFGKASLLFCFFFVVVVFVLLLFFSFWGKEGVSIVIITVVIVVFNQFTLFLIFLSLKIHPADNPPGTYRNRTDPSMYHPCAVDQYQPERWQFECLPCQSGFRAESEGSTLESDCKCEELFFFLNPS